MEITWLTVGWCFKAAFIILLALASLSLFSFIPCLFRKRKVSEATGCVQLSYMFAALLFLPFFFSLLVVRCTVDENIGTHVYVIDSLGKKSVDEIHHTYFLRHPKYGDIDSGVYIENNTDYDLIMYSVGYGTEKYSASNYINIPAHSFIKVDHYPSYLFSEPPTSIKSKSSGRTLWAIKLNE